jgi:hypothetical protein
MSSPKEPKTDTQWQEAVSLADMHLKIFDAKLYGLVEGGPEIDQARCLDILSGGRKRKIFPRWNDGDMQRLLAEYAGGSS